MDELTERIIKNVLLDLKQRWPGGSRCANTPNVVGFLNFRLRNLISDIDRENTINHFLTILW